MKTVRVCIACCSRDIATTGPANLFKCNTCGTLLVSDYDQHIRENTIRFENDYIHSGNQWLFEEYREPALTNIAALLKRHDSGWNNFLDIGSATGHLFRYYKFAEMDRVTSVEPSRYGCAVMKRAFPFLEIKEGDIDGIVLDTKKYDVVTILDTLYFHPRPADLLKKARVALVHEGMLVCEVPNYRWLNSIGRVRSKDKGTLWRAYYTREAIREVIRLNGFDIIEVSHNIGNVPNGMKGIMSRFAYCMTRILYAISGGRWDWVPKIIIVAKKHSSKDDVHAN